MVVVPEAEEVVVPVLLVLVDPLAEEEPEDVPEAVDEAEVDPDPDEEDPEAALTPAM